VRYGINQRVAQEVLGHSDANLTAKIYTDVPALALHTEVAKLPWISSIEAGAQMGALNSGVSGHAVSLPDIFSKFVELVQSSGRDDVMAAMASAVTSCHSSEMAARAGIEPATK
jgi:hypothetical protein